MARRDDVRSVHSAYIPVFNGHTTIHIRKNTQKSNFCYALKKRPYHFKESVGSRIRYNNLSKIRSRSASLHYRFAVSYFQFFFKQLSLLFNGRDLSLCAVAFSFLPSCSCSFLADKLSSSDSLSLTQIYLLLLLL